MRIRRRPPGQPIAYLLPSDPRAAKPPPPASGDHQERPAGEDKKDLHLHPNAAADLGVGGHRSSPARRPALLSLLPPQDGPVERSKGLGAQQQGPADGHRSLENGGRHVPEPMIMTGERLSNGATVTMVAVTTTTTAVIVNATKKQGGGDGGSGSNKKPRGPGVLMEGSRCSRKNGRGWRCSQPTLVGYALCQYHLGKGRTRSTTTAAAGRSGAGQLGRTENGKRASAAAAAAAAAPPKADVPLLPPPPPPSPPRPKADVPLLPPPPPPSVQHL